MRAERTLRLFFIFSANRISHAKGFSRVQIDHYSPFTRSDEAGEIS